MLNELLGRTNKIKYKIHYEKQLCAVVASHIKQSKPEDYCVSMAVTIAGSSKSGREVEKYFRL